MRTLGTPALAGGVVEDVQQHGVVLEHLHDGQQRLRLAELRLRQQGAHAQTVRARQLAFLQARQHLVERHAHERVAEGLDHALAQSVFDLVQRLAVEHVAEEALHLGELVGSHLFGELHLAVEHLAVLGDEHDERPVRGQRDERQLLDVQVEHRRRQHDGQAVGEARERRRRLLEQRIELARAAAQLVHHGTVALVVAREVGLQQVVHERAVAVIGRDAARRGVRLRDVAAVLEDGQLVAHRCRTHAQLVPLRQRARPHGQSARDVLFDKALSTRCLRSESTLVHLPLSLVGPHLW